MEMNFAFLEKKQEYELFSGACIDAERILESSPVMSAVASRKALELCSIRIKREIVWKLNILLSECRIKQDGDMWIMLYGEIQERLLL